MINETSQTQNTFENIYITSLDKYFRAVYVIGRFDIHRSVHRKYNSKLQPTRCNVSWFIYFYRRATSFRWFLCPSSGAHNCTYSLRYCQPTLQQYWL